MTPEPGLEVLAIIPVRGIDVETADGPVLLGGKPLIGYTIQACLESPVIGRTVLTTDSPTVRELASQLGAEVPMLRPGELAAADVTLDRVLQHCLLWLEEEEDYHPDLVASLEVSHPLRPPDLLRQVVEMLVEHQMDTIFTAYEERHAYWRLNEYGQLVPVNSSPEKLRSSLNPLYRELAGLALACRAHLIRDGKRFGQRIGIVPVRDTYALVDTQDPTGLFLGEHLLSTGWGEFTSGTDGANL